MDDPVTRAERKNQFGNNFYGLKQYENAIVEYSKAIQICPQIAKYYGNRGACYLMMADYIKAFPDLKKSIELDNGYKKGYTRIGKCCLGTGDMKYAENILARAKGIFTEDNDILEMYNKVKHIQENLQKYEIKLEHQQYEEALNCIEKCREMSPNCLKYITNKARCLIFLQRYDEAETLADEVLKYKSIDEDAIYIKGTVKIYQEDPDTALKLSKELKKKLPDNRGATTLFRRSTMIQKNYQEINIALKEKNYGKAYDLLSDTIKIDETRKFINKKLYKQKIEIAGKDKKLLWNGIDDCTHYLLTYEKDKDILKTRAEYYMKIQEYEDAVEDYKELIKLENSEKNKEMKKKAEELLEDQLKHDHKILKINAKATKEEIKSAAAELIKRYHPDKNYKANSARKKILEQKLIRVRNAQSNLLKKAK